MYKLLSAVVGCIWETWELSLTLCVCKMEVDRGRRGCWVWEVSI